MDRAGKIHLGVLVSTAAVGLGAGGYEGFCHAQNIPRSKLGLGLRFLGPPFLGTLAGGIAGGITCEEEDAVDGYAKTYFVVSAASVLVGFGLGYLAGHLTR